MLCTLFYVANAQTEQTRTFGYNYYGQRINEKAICNMVSFRSKEVAEKAVDEIVRRSGLKRNFYVMECPNTDNCFAAINGQTRLIVYDGAFMQKANSISKTDWGALSILAHEIGHHLQGHTIIEGGSDPQKELEADEFSGFVMYQMGASLKEAQAAISKLTSDYDGGTHPPRTRRLAAIEKGYRSAQELYPNVKKNDGSVITSIPPRQSTEVQNPTQSQRVPQSVDNVDKDVNNPVDPIRRTDGNLSGPSEVAKIDPDHVDNSNSNVRNPACIEGDCGNGFGKMINIYTQERYEGEWRNSKREGRGVEYYADGEKKYVGNFIAGRYGGNGTYFYKNGDKYVGKYKNGMMNDERGYFIYNNNMRLVVKVVNNKKTGRALRLYPDGRKEETYFDNDVERKTYRDANGRIINTF
ncbi:M48 family metalloprotease [Emticicia sp. BO119]|nr:M48 family metalloprotease [Emticicia sp. BO119]